MVLFGTLLAYTQAGSPLEALLGTYVGETTIHPNPADVSPLFLTFFISKTIQIRKNPDDYHVKWHLTGHTTDTFELVKHRECKIR